MKPDSTPVEIELTETGYLRIARETANTYFPADSLIADCRADELWLVPLVGPESGGLLLKQRNAAGDRSTLIWQALPSNAPTGVRPATWDPDHAALRVDLRNREGHECEK